MADFSEMQIQITLTIAEMRDLVALLNLAGEAFDNEAKIPAIVHEVSEMYFQLMENLKDGYLGDFQPE